MKRNILWSLFACLLSMTMSMAFVACGDDDNDSETSGGNTPAPPVDDTTIVGCWKAAIPASGDDLVTRYNHMLMYAFENDSTFKMLTVFFTIDTPISSVESAINSATSFDDAVTNANFQGEVNMVYFQGDYQVKGDSIALSIKDYSEYNYERKWCKLYQSSRPMAELVYAFKLANGKLTLTPRIEWDGVFNNHHTLVGELSRVATIKVFPEVPDMSPIIGEWKMDNDLQHSSAISFDLWGTVNYRQTFATSGTRPNGRDYDKTMVSHVGEYTYANGKVSITYNYISTGYYKGTQRVDVDIQNIEEAGRVVNIDDVTVNGNKMTLWEETWTKQE